MSKPDKHVTKDDPAMVTDKDRALATKLVDAVFNYRTADKTRRSTQIELVAEMLASERSLLKPVSHVAVPDGRTAEGAKKLRENADYYRDTLKPFA